MSRFSSRMRLAIVATTAFVVGLLFASGFNLTPFGYAQQSATSGQTPARDVQPMKDASNAFVSIAEHVTPAVVSVQSEKLARGGRDLRRPRGIRPQNIPPDFEDLFRQFDQRRNEPVESTGSGFIVSSDGYILTNNHVVADADRVNITLLDKRIFKAKVIGRDPSTDVAVVKIEGSNFPTIPFGNDETSRVGEWVLAVGNPLGLEFTVTAGIISAKGRSGSLRTLYQENGQPNLRAIVDYIQTDAAINPGNSGGPLINSRGEVIGINSAIASPTGTYAGYGFAIPISLAKATMDELIKFGRVQRPALGVLINEVTAADAQAAGLKEIRGAIVEGFPSDEESPARNAGLETGDIIIAVNGRAIDRVATLQRLVRLNKAGDMLAVDVQRFGEKKSFKVKLADSPDPKQVASGERDGSATAQPATFDKLGIAVEPVNAEMVRAANLTEAQRGLLVLEVDPNSGARGLLQERGDIILQVLAPGPRRSVRTVADLDRAISSTKAGDVVSLFVYSIPSKTTKVVSLRPE